jgi:hypothetical protein
MTAKGAPWTSTTACRLMCHEQHVHAVEQLGAGAYGHLVNRTALLHPKGKPSIWQWDCVAYSRR